MSSEDSASTTGMLFCFTAAARYRPTRKPVTMISPPGLIGCSRQQGHYGLLTACKGNELSLRNM